MMNFLVDSHCHLDYLKIKEVDGGLDAVIKRAAEKNVGAFLTIGVSQKNAATVKEIAEQYNNVYCAVGIHPLELSDTVVDLDWLLTALDHPKAVAIGETGLDLHYAPDTLKQQYESFELHLEAAKHTNKPVVIHTREARALTLEALKKVALNQAGVLHCYTEDWDMAKAALDLGYYISLSGIITFNNADSLREVAKKIPMDRLLVETDSPYLTPMPHRGKPNFPEYVRVVAEYVAQLKQVPFEEFTQQTTCNFFNLFQLATQ